MARSTSGKRRKGAESTPNSGATTGHEAELWAMADALRGSMDAAEYKHVVLGLIFLKYISDAFEERRAAVLAEWGEDTAEDRDEYTAENIFRVPPEARWAHLKAQARQSTVGLTVDAAMAAIERDNPALEDVLPRDFARLSLDKQRLGQLIDLVSNIQVGDADARSRDVLGRVYEYFLSQFKVAGTTAPTNAGYVGDSGSGASGCEKSQANHGANGTVDGVRLQVDSRARELRVAGLERSDWREWSGKEQPVEPFSDDRAAFRETASGGHDEARLADCGRGDFPSYVLPEMQRWRVFHFQDVSRLAGVRQSSTVRDNLRLKEDAGNPAPFLRSLRERHPVHYRRVVDAVRTAAPFFGDFVYREGLGMDDRLELEWFHASDRDTVLGPHQLSDGTLRFLCLATLLLQPVELQPSLILMDEPELGQHPAALAVLAEMLRTAGEERQVVVATQSADLVSELDPEDVVVVDREDDASTFRRLDGEDLRDWLKDYSLGDLWKMNVFGGRPR